MEVESKEITREVSEIQEEISPIPAVEPLIPEKTVKPKKAKEIDFFEPKKKKKPSSVSAPIPAALTAKEREELAKTESEVDVKKKKFVCIVHRGIIQGNIYLCPQCQSFYCDRCAKVLKLKGEKCWYCGKDIEVSITDQDKLKFLEKRAIELIEEIIEETPFIREYIETNKLHAEIPEIREYIFSILHAEDLDKIDLLDLSMDEKKEFIKEIINLDAEKRKQLLDDMLSGRE